jgi:hypothetical protein
MALSQTDLNAIAAAQAKYPTLSQNNISLLGIANLESASQSNPDTAVSSTGAQGLFQVLPSTAANPGYGVSPLSDPNDPNASANFAGAYITGLINSGDTPTQAINAYSGGGYSLSQVQAAANNGSENFGRYGEAVTNPNTGLGTPAQIATTPTLASTASGAYAWIVELVERGGIVILGIGIVIVGLIFLLEDSKTETVKLSALGAMPSATS